MDRVALITGASRGIGAAAARAFARDGYRVAVNYLSQHAAAQALVCELRDAGAEAVAISADVSDRSQVDEMVRQVEQQLGSVDVLVNNAGISLHEASFYDVTPETFDKQINTNLKGAFFLTQEFVRYLKSTNRGGNILFVSSETGDTMDFRPYGFTKVAVNSMVQGLAYLFKKEGIRVNAVAPGVTASDMTGFKSDGNISAGEYATGRIYLPEEVAETACFLVSDASGCISGQIITCNNAQTVNARWK